MAACTSPQKGVEVEVSGIGLHIPRGQVLLKIVVGDVGSKDGSRWETATRAVASFDAQRAYEFGGAMQDEAIAAGFVPQAKIVDIEHPELPRCVDIHNEKYLQLWTSRGLLLKRAKDFADLHPGGSSRDCFVYFWDGDGDKESWTVKHSTEEVMKCLDEATKRVQIQRT